MTTQRKADRVQMTSEAFAKQDYTSVYWLGNGGALLNVRGTVIVIDPLLAGFDMPIYTEAPLLPEEVVRADAVLITHCDNDHFSKVTLTEIKDRTGAFHAPHYVAGLMKDIGIEGVGHDIHESFMVGDCKVTLTPADHAWQNESPKHSKERYFAMEDYCGFRIDTPEDGSIWMPGDSRLMEEQLHQEPFDLMLMDISDGSWHIGLPGVKKLAAAYPDTKLLPIHWGCVKSEWKEFNGNPDEVKEMIDNPDRFYIAAAGEEVKL